MGRARIAAIEDEANILEVINYNLKREGYEVMSSQDGLEGIKLIRSRNPDLVLLDLMLPGMDGIEVCRQLKNDPVTRPIPIIIVTAKGEESDVVLGLGLGADDYVTKPFSPRELIARVKAVLRRGRINGDGSLDERVVRGNVLIDAGRMEVLIGGEQVIFTATEFRLLHYLAAHPGRVFTREQLINHAIGDESIVLDRNIDVHIRSIRKKLDDYRDMIETIRGVGYRFRDA